jgi:hypothetical protein
MSDTLDVIIRERDHYRKAASTRTRDYTEMKQKYNAEVDSHQIAKTLLKETEQCYRTLDFSLDVSNKSVGLMKQKYETEVAEHEKTKTELVLAKSHNDTLVKELAEKVSDNKLYRYSSEVSARLHDTVKKDHVDLLKKLEIAQNSLFKTKTHNEYLTQRIEESERYEAHLRSQITENKNAAEQGKEHTLRNKYLSEFAQAALDEYSDADDKLQKIKAALEKNLEPTV